VGKREFCESTVRRLLGCDLPNAAYLREVC
jgi:hypothetical protein